MNADEPSRAEALEKELAALKDLVRRVVNHWYIGDHWVGRGQPGCQCLQCKLYRATK